MLLAAFCRVSYSKTKFVIFFNKNTVDLVRDLCQKVRFSGSYRVCAMVETYVDKVEYSVKIQSDFTMVIHFSDPKLYPVGGGNKGFQFLRNASLNLYVHPKSFFKLHLEWVFLNRSIFLSDHLSCSDLAVFHFSCFMI